MPPEAPPECIKAYVRQVYQRLVARGSANLSDAPVPHGENLARVLGYDTVQSPISKQAWALFAGCGNPLQSINIEPEWTVVDLGCGVGIDCQIAGRCLQPPGRVIGLDFTEELLRLAQGYTPVELKGRCHWVATDCEHLPIRGESVHLAVANGSFNLMPHKEMVLAEIHRVLVPSGHLALADLIRVAEVEPLTEGFEDAWAWCVAGALSPSEYELVLKDAGFSWWQLRSTHSYGPFAVAHLLARKGCGR